MENQNTSGQPLFDLKLDDTSKEHILKTSSWAMVIVIVTVIGYVLTVFRYFVQRNELPQAYEKLGIQAPASATGTFASMIVEILIGGLITFFLFQFANFTKKGIRKMDQAELNRGFVGLKTYFLIIGVLIILAVVFVSLGVLAFGMGRPA